MTEEKTYTVRELWDLVRRGMIWRGKSIENKVDKMISATMWVKEEDITPGITAVKAAAMHDNYVQWCKDRGITGKGVLNLITFGRVLQKYFKSVRYENSTHYYINKNFDENPEKKAERQKTYSQKKTKKSKEETK